MESFNQNKYEKAKKRVETIKGFYTHATIFILVNLFILAVNMGLFNGEFRVGMPIWAYISTPFFWGLGLLFHGLYVFQNKFSFFKNWEERKIKEYMDKERQELDNTFKK